MAALTASVELDELAQIDIAHYCQACHIHLGINLGGLNQRVAKVVPDLFEGESFCQQIGRAGVSQTVRPVALHLLAQRLLTTTDQCSHASARNQRAIWLEH